MGELGLLWMSVRLPQYYHMCLDGLRYSHATLNARGDVLTASHFYTQHPPLGHKTYSRKKSRPGIIAKQELAGHRGQREIDLEQETQSIQLLMEVWYDIATRDVDGHADHLISKQFPSPIHPLSSPQ